MPSTTTTSTLCLTCGNTGTTSVGVEGSAVPCPVCTVLDRPALHELCERCNRPLADDKPTRVGSQWLCLNCATFTAVTFDCPVCERTVTQVPVRDAEEVSWVGLARARAYCSHTCLEVAAERHGVGRGY